MGNKCVCFKKKKNPEAHLADHKMLPPDKQVPKEEVYSPPIEPNPPKPQLVHQQTSLKKDQPFLKKAGIPIYDDLLNLELLGQGGFGKVFRAWNKRKGTFLALKFFKDTIDEIYQDILFEDFILTTVNKVSKGDDSFLKYEGLFRSSSDSNSFMIVMESGEVELKKIIEARKAINAPYTLSEGLYIIQSLVKDFLLLQTHRIANRDIKPANVILVEQKKGGTKENPHYQYKITDFGIGMVLEEGKTRIPLEYISYTPKYAAPELLRKAEEGEDYDPFKADCYSMAITLLDIFGLKLENFNESSILTQKVKSLLRDMLMNSPEERIGFKEILERLEGLDVKIKQPENERFYINESKDMQRKKLRQSKELYTNYFDNYKLYISIGNFDRAKEFISLMEKVVESSKDFEKNEGLDLIREKCLLYFDLQDYKEALKLGLAYLLKCEKIFDSDDIHYGEACHLLANIYSHIKENEESEKVEKLYLTALSNHLKHINKNSLQTVKIYSDCANFYETIQEKFDKAEEFYKKALKTLEDLNVDKDRELANIYVQMAFFYQEKKTDLEKAEEYFKKGVEIQKKVLGEYHPDTAKSYHFLGRFYSAFKFDREKAQEYLFLAIRHREEIFGPNHPITAESYHELANFYKDLLEDDELAEKYYLLTKKIREEALGLDHYLTSDIYNDLGIFYEDKRNDFILAEHYYMDSLTIAKRFYTENHTEVAKRLDNLGVFYKNRKGKDFYNEAEAAYLKALEIYQSVFKGKSHKYFASTYEHLGVFYQRCKKDLELAENYYKKTLEMREELLGDESDETGDICFKMGYFYGSVLHDLEKGEHFYSRALTIYEKVLGETHNTTIKLMDTLASFYVKEAKDLKKAELNYERLCNVLEKDGEKAAKNIAIYKNVTTFYENQVTNYVKALEVSHKILKIQKESKKKEEHEEKEIANTLFGIGMVSLKLKNWLEANKAFKEALTIREKYYAKDASEILECYEKINLSNE